MSSLSILSAISSAAATATVTAPSLAETMASAAPASTTTVSLLPSPTSFPSLLLPSNNELLNCRLVGPFSIFIQALVGTLGFSTLIIKRYFETPRRPWLVWSFDVSKQMISGAIMHMVNLLVSALSGGSAEPGETATNPCSWYVLNLTIDCTLGVLFVALYIRLFEKLAAYLKITDVLESGNYGNPPSWQRWLKQATLFCASMVSMKLTVVTLIRLIPSLVVIGDLVLKPVQLTNSPRFQIIFVMAVWPLMLNIFESWILDQFIKRKVRHGDYPSASGHIPLPTDDISPDLADGVASFEMSNASTLTAASRSMTRPSSHRDTRISIDVTDIVMNSPGDNEVRKMRSVAEDDILTDVDSDSSDYANSDYANGTNPHAQNSRSKLHED